MVVADSYIGDGVVVRTWVTNLSGGAVHGYCIERLYTFTNPDIEGGMP